MLVVLYYDHLEASDGVGGGDRIDSTYRSANGREHSSERGS